MSNITDDEINKNDAIENSNYVMDSINTSIFGHPNPRVFFTNGNSLEETVEEIIKQHNISNKNSDRFYNDPITELILGPYTTSANRVVSATDVRVLWQGNGAGVYIADIYSYQLSIPFPEDVTYVILDSEEPADLIGYMNITDQETGVNVDNVVVNGVTNLVCNTMAIKLKRNIIGQNVNVTMPFDSQRVRYKYYYLMINY